MTSVAAGRKGSVAGGRAGGWGGRMEESWLDGVENRAGSWTFSGPKSRSQDCVLDTKGSRRRDLSSEVV